MDSEHFGRSIHTLILVEESARTPRGEGRKGADLIVHGHLANFLQLQTTIGPASGEADCMLAMVAGVGFEPTTFRL